MRVATIVTLDNVTGEVTIDGEPFGLYLSAEPIRVIVGGRDSMSVVYLPLLVDVEGTITINGEKPEPGEHSVPPRPAESAVSGP